MKKLAIATTAALIWLGGVVLSPAAADYIKTYTDPDDGDYVQAVYDDNGNWKGSHLYDKDNVYQGSIYPESNPSPESSSSGPKGDFASRMRLAMQNALLKGIIGGKTDVETFWSTPFGMALTRRGHGSPLAPIHLPGEAGYEGEGIHGGGGGFDPTGGSLAEQLKKRAKKGSKEDDDDEGGSGPTHGDEPFGGLPGPPELVNPPPVPAAAMADQQPEAAARPTIPQTRITPSLPSTEPPTAGSLEPAPHRAANEGRVGVK